MWNWSLMPITTPPLAVPSSLVMVSDGLRGLGELPGLFEGVLSGRTVQHQHHLCGALGDNLPITLRILVSLFIRPTLLCRRPAVSISTTSALFATADFKVSKATDAGSGAHLLTDHRGAARSAHTANWSMAAARNVSAAPIDALRPARVSWAASLPIVVVLPAPFTPTTMMT